MKIKKYDREILRNCTKIYFGIELFKGKKTSNRFEYGEQYEQVRK